MNFEFKKNLPLGISLLRIFYTINAFLFLITSIIFFEYLDILIFGKVMPPIAAGLIRLILITFPAYLVLVISLLKKECYHSAIVYHLFFILNGLSILFYLLNQNLKLKPFLEIAVKPEYRVNSMIGLFGISSQAYVIQIFGIFINILIIAYLFKKRKVFSN
jgi:hypothetical protein